MTTTDGESDFYEEDEAPEDMWEPFERAEKTVTKRPGDLDQSVTSTVGDATETPEAAAPR